MLNGENTPEASRRPLVESIQESLYGLLSRFFVAPSVQTHEVQVVGRGDVVDVTTAVGWDGLPHSNLKEVVSQG